MRNKNLNHSSMWIPLKISIDHLWKRDYAFNSLRVRMISCFVWYGTPCTTRAHNREFRTASGRWFWGGWSRKLEKIFSRSHNRVYEVWFLSKASSWTKALNSWTFIEVEDVHSHKRFITSALPGQNSFCASETSLADWPDSAVFNMKILSFQILHLIPYLHKMSVVFLNYHHSSTAL